MYFQNILYKQDIKLSLCSVFEKLKNSTFFITGASGLVGSALIDVLRYLNEYHNYQIKIYGVFSSEKSLYARFPDYNNISDFYPVIQNIMDEIKCDAYADFVVHAASNTHPKLYAEVPVETMLLNFLGTNNVLEYARKILYPIDVDIMWKQSIMSYMSTKFFYGIQNICSDGTRGNGDGFFSFRCSRINYYGVMGMLARVYSYKRDTLPRRAGYELTTLP